MKTSQRLFGLIDVVGPVTVGISREHALVQRPRFRQMLSFGHHCGSPEGAGGAERVGINRRTERLAQHMVSPRPHPGRGFSSREHHALELVDDQDQLRGIGGDETLLVARPQRHDGWRRLCLGRSSRDTTWQPPRRKHEQTDGPTHGHLSVICACSYRLEES